MSKEIESWVKRHCPNDWKAKLCGLIGGSALIGGAVMIWKNKASQQDNIPLLAPEKWSYFLGHFLWMVEANEKGTANHEWGERMIASNEPCLSTGGAFGPPVVFLLDPTLVKFVFEDEFDMFEKPESLHQRFIELFGDGIFVTNGEPWKFHRRTASRMFSMRNLKDYMYECAVSNADKCIQRLKEVNETDSRVAIDINDILGRFTLDSFIEISFGKSLNIMESFPEKHDFCEAFDHLLNNLQKRRWDFFWEWKKKFNIGEEKINAEKASIVSKFVEDLIDIDTRRKLVDESGVQQHDLLSLHIKQNPNITRHELRDAALNLIVAGRDTTRMLLSWFLYVIQDKPDVKAKIIKEIDDMGTLTYDNANSKLKYLEGALLETLRLYPSVPMLVRMAKKDVQLPVDQKYIIRKGELVVIHTWSQTRNPKIFKDPLKFDPLRWEHGVTTYPPHIFPQFNLSPRLCLGRTFSLLEAKIFVCRFFKAFEYQPVSSEQPVIAVSPILNMKYGYPMYLKSL